MIKEKKTYKRKFTQEQILAAIKASNGNKSKAAEQIGCSRPTIDNYLSKYPELQKSYEEITESKIDNVEDTLYEMAIDGKLPAVMFFLKTVGKRRGYTEGKPQTSFELTDKAKAILTDLRESKISALEAALSFELEGLPIPDSVRLLLSKETFEPNDPNAETYATISDEEMERRAAERKAQIAAQREGLDARRAEIQELRAEAVDAFSEEAQEATPHERL